MAVSVACEPCAGTAVRGPMESCWPGFARRRTISRSGEPLIKTGCIGGCTLVQPAVPADGDGRKEKTQEISRVASPIEVWWRLCGSRAVHSTATSGRSTSCCSFGSGRSRVAWRSRLN